MKFTQQGAPLGIKLPPMPNAYNEIPPAICGFANFRTMK